MNRAAFAEAMRAGADAALEGKWEQAVAAYQRAVAEMPRDANALTALGLACFNAGRLESALEAYRQASELTPDNPVLFERIGSTYERLGRAEAAAEAYMAAARLYLQQPQGSGLAAERWRDAVRAHPGHIQAHAHLLQHYQKAGRVKEAVSECMALAQLYLGRGQRQAALQIYRYALQLSPRNPDVQAALDAVLHADQAPISSPLELVTETPPSEMELVGVPGVGEGHRRVGLVDRARRRALAALAESVFDERGMTDGRPGVAGWIAQAVDFHTRGQPAEAIAAYERALAAGGGGAPPALHFCLGLLYLEQGRVDEARAQFEQASAEDEYSLSGHFALGEHYRAQGQPHPAVEQFIAALRIVDLGSSRADLADGVARDYERPLDHWLGAAGPEGATALADSLFEFLSIEGLQERVAQMRPWMDRLSTHGSPVSLLEVLAVPNATCVLGALSQTHEYLERGMSYAALEECYYALSCAPGHLPTHRMVAHILLEVGKTEDAIAKWVAIADTYHVRGDVAKAVAMYESILQAAPMEMGVRARLKSLLVNSGRVDEALEQYMALADAYYQLAQMERACETYEEALQVAPRARQPREWETRILHELADIYMQRVDWKRATGVYERIRRLAPADERARLALMQLYHRLNRPDLAVAELDDLLTAVRRSGRPERVFAILEQAVAERPTDIALQTRLAQAYLNTGQVEQALVSLDRLGDLQIETGRVEEAKATIRAIIALNPPNADQYRALLEQLG